MEKYHELKTRHQEEINNFPMFFAFNNRQLFEGMEKLGLKPTDTDEVYSLGGTGGYYRKTDSKKLYGMFDRHEKELAKAMKNDSFALEAFKYELANHEYSVTLDVTPALTALGLSLSDIKKDIRLNALLDNAKQSQKAMV